MILKVNKTAFFVFVFTRTLFAGQTSSYSIEVIYFILFELNDVVMIYINLIVNKISW